MTTGRGSKSLILRGPEKNVAEIGGKRVQTCVAMTQDGHSDQFFWRAGAAFATLNGFHAPPNFVSHPRFLFRICRTPRGATHAPAGTLTPVPNPFKTLVGRLISNSIKPTSKA